MKSITDKIIARIKRKGRGWVFTPSDFLDVGTRASVDQVLSRLTNSDKIRRLDRGLYDFPKQHKLFGTLSPTADNIAIALADGDDIVPSGAMAANMLGFSTQVPAKSVFATNATSCVRKIDGNVITLKKAHVPIFSNLPSGLNLFLQTLAYLGKRNIDNLVLDRSVRILSDSDIKKLHSVANRLPYWISDTIHKIDNRKNGQIPSAA